MRLTDVHALKVSGVVVIFVLVVIFILLLVVILLLFHWIVGVGFYVSVVVYVDLVFGVPQDVRRCAGELARSHAKDSTQQKENHKYFDPPKQTAPHTVLSLIIIMFPRRHIITISLIGHFIHTSVCLLEMRGERGTARPV